MPLGWLCLGAALLFFAAFPPAVQGDEADEIKDETALFFQLSSRPEMKIGISHSYIFPFLQGETSLTRGNNIKTTFSAELSPVSLNAIADFTWTPVAFFQITGGIKAGSGWNIEMFGKEAKGYGINRPRSAADPTEEIAGSPFGGLLWSAFGGGTLQFDLAAIIPGDWNHIVLRAYQELRYKGNSAAGRGESWYFENDDGENRNGFIHYGSCVLGYQMPLKLNMIGFMAEMTRLLYDTPGRERWGDDLSQWMLSAFANYEFNKEISATFIVQGRTRRNYLNGDDKTFYQLRELDTNNTRHLEFFRAALILNYRLR